MIAPAPRKPIPVTICAAIRVGSVLTSAPPLTRKSWKPYAETSVNSADPTDTSMCVRKPASRSRSSRSSPMAPPRAAATASRSRICPQVRDGTSASGIEYRFLGFADRLDPRRAEVEQLVQPGPVEGRALRGRLHLDETAAPGHDEVEVDLGPRVLRVVEVEQRLAFDDAQRDRCHRVRQRAREPRPSQG